jgi:hypothetical protein
MLLKIFGNVKLHNHPNVIKHQKFQVIRHLTRSRKDSNPLEKLLLMVWVMTGMEEEQIQERKEKKLKNINMLNKISYYFVYQGKRLLR